jgi:hypothetical protein
MLKNLEFDNKLMINGVKMSEFVIIFVGILFFYSVLIGGMHLKKKRDREIRIISRNENRRLAEIEYVIHEGAVVRRQLTPEQQMEYDRRIMEINANSDASEVRKLIINAQESIVNNTMENDRRLMELTANPEQSEIRKLIEGVNPIEETGYEEIIAISE